MIKWIIALGCVCALAVAVPFASARKSSSSVSGLDKQSLKTSIEGDLFEIRGGQIAEKKTHNKAVVRLAKRLVSDHTKSYSDSSTLAKKLGIDVPKDPAPSMQWELKMVSTLKGRAFNHWYSSLEVYDHEQDIQETKDEIKDGSNKEVVKNAKTELPMLRMHLKLARKALKANP